MSVVKPGNFLGSLFRREPADNCVRYVIYLLSKEPRLTRDAVFQRLSDLDSSISRDMVETAVTVLVRERTIVNIAPKFEKGVYILTRSGWGSARVVTLDVEGRTSWKKPKKKIKKIPW